MHCTGELGSVKSTSAPVSSAGTPSRKMRHRHSATKLSRPPMYRKSAPIGPMTALTTFTQMLFTAMEVPTLSWE